MLPRLMSFFETLEGSLVPDDIFPEPVNFDFQMHKTHFKSFVFEILFIGDYSSTFYLFDGKV